MAMSLPRLLWIRMLSSGPMKMRCPSRWLAKVTPSSLIFRSPARENTWNPPESVRMGPSQRMNLCSPPIARTTSSPGRRCRWYVLDSSICVPSRSFRSTALTPPLMAACVPTFMNTGVCTSPPWAQVNTPRRAFPSFFMTLNIYLSRSQCINMASPKEKNRYLSSTACR